VNPIDRSRRRFLLASGATGAGLALPSLAQQQAYPTKPVKVVVGFAAGGGSDIIARLLSQGLNERLGQPFVVENKSGAGGNIATSFVIKSPPDGYNLLLTSVGQVVVNPHTDSSLQGDPVKELSHITMIAEGDLILGVHVDVPVTNIQEFIAYAKSNPGKLNYGTTGAGSNIHAFMEYFLMAAGIKVEAIHYRGGAAMSADVMSGQVQVALNGLHSLDAYFKAGKMRPLLVIGKQREQRFPDVPTCSDIGMPQLSVCTNWFGLHAPVATPAPVVGALWDATAAVLKTDAVREKLSSMGLRIVGDSSREFTARIERDYVLFGDVVKKAKVRAA